MMVGHGVLLIAVGLLLFVIASSRVVILQESDINFVEDELTSFSNVYQYAKYHEYDYKIIQINYTLFEEYSHLSRSWIKLFAINELIKSGNYTYIVYIDNNLFIQTLHTPVTQLLTRWSPFSDIYFLLNRDIRWGDPGAGITKLTVDDRTANKVHSIDIAWDGNFQIWKNTLENQRMIEKWISLTKIEIEARIWKAQYPYEMGAFQTHLFPNLNNNNRVYGIEFHEGSDNEGFLMRKNHIIQEISLFKKKNDDFPSTFNMTESMLLNLSLSITNYNKMPEQWIETKFTMKDIDNDNFDFTMNIRFARSDVSFFFHSYGEQLYDYCNNQRINRTECQKLIDYITIQQKDKLNELNQYFPEQYYQKFIQKNANFFQTRQPSLLPMQMNQAFPRVIITIFAGRRNRLMILMKYLRLALSLNYIQEVHLWDYFRNDEDRSVALKEMINPKIGVYLKPRITNQDGWVDYYEYYDQHRLLYPNDIIMKCDDDIVFIDVFQLPYFIRRFQEEESLFDGVLFANIINNGITAHYQQKILNLLPEEELGEFEYPEGGFCGSLWNSGERANKLHDYFLQNWEKIILPQTRRTSNTTSNNLDDVDYQPEFIPLTTRFSINFFAMHVKNWYKIRDIGNDDEYLLTYGATKYNIMKNYISNNFFVSHLAFYKQEKDLDTSRLLSRYEALYDEYVKRFR